MAEDETNTLTLKDNSNHTGKLYLPTASDITTLSTVNAIDPTARFIVSSTEPSTADDGKIWIEVPSKIDLSGYIEPPVTFINLVSYDGSIAEGLYPFDYYTADITPYSKTTGDLVNITIDLVFTMYYMPAKVVANKNTPVSIPQCTLADLSLCTSCENTGVTEYTNRPVVSVVGSMPLSLQRGSLHGAGVFIATTSKYTGDNLVYNVSLTDSGTISIGIYSGTVTLSKAMAIKEQVSGTIICSATSASAQKSTLVLFAAYKGATGTYTGISNVASIAIESITATWSTD